MQKTSQKLNCNISKTINVKYMHSIQNNSFEIVLTSEIKPNVHIVKMTRDYDARIKAQNPKKSVTVTINFVDLYIRI